MKKYFVSLILVLSVLVSCFAVPVYADTLSGGSGGYIPDQYHFRCYFYDFLSGRTQYYFVYFSSIPNVTGSSSPVISFSSATSVRLDIVNKNGSVYSSTSYTSFSSPSVSSLSNFSGNFYHNTSSPMCMPIDYINFVPGNSDGVDFGGIDTSDVGKIDENDKSKFKPFIPYTVPELTLPEFDPAHPLESLGAILGSFFGWLSSLLPGFFTNLITNLGILMDNITKFPAMISNLFKDLFEKLFVPKDGFLQARFDSVQSVLLKKFPFVTQLELIYSSIISTLNSATSLGLPPNSSITLWGGTYNFSDFSVISDVILIVKTMLGVFLYVKWIHSLSSRLPNIIAGVRF